MLNKALAKLGIFYFPCMNIIAQDIMWKKNFGGNFTERFECVSILPDGIIAGGNATISFLGTVDWEGMSGKGREDAIIVKYDNNGNVVWKKNFGSGAGNIFHAVTAVSDGIVAAGQSSTFDNGDWEGITGKGDKDAIIVKYDNNGNVV